MNVQRKIESDDSQKLERQEREPVRMQMMTKILNPWPAPQTNKYFNEKHDRNDEGNHKDKSLNFATGYSMVCLLMAHDFFDTCNLRRFQ